MILDISQKTNMEEFCFVVFSHTGTEEKEEILYKSLKSIKNFGFPIVLASHLPVSEKNQKIVDYFIKDRDNLIVNESEIFNPIAGTQLSDNLYYIHDLSGGKTFSTNTFKQTYQAGVFNLYINSVNLVKDLGFRNIILWEFDFILGERSAINLSEIIEIYLKSNYKYFSFTSYIQNLKCMHAIPSIFNVELLSSILPKKPIRDPKSFAWISNMMIMEQWIGDRVWKSRQPGLDIDYSHFNSYLPDSSKGQIHSQLGNYLYFNLRSGLYFSDSSSQIIFFGNNSSNINLNCKLEIFDNYSNKIIFNVEHDLPISTWVFDLIPDEVINIINSEIGVKVMEKVINLDENIEHNFNYLVNKENLPYLKKLRKFSN